MLDLTKSFQTFPVLATARLHLREMVPQDAEALFALYSDPQVMAGHGSPVFKTIGKAQQRIDWYAEAFRDMRALRWAITRHEDDTVLGTCGFHEISARHHRAEIGYELAPAFWRQGIMFEAVSAVVRFGLMEIGFHRIEANVDPNNHASASLLRKVGFTEEGYFRERFFDSGRFVDDWFFSILASELNKLEEK
jgi:ribosomal-protein-alanine N-acetyltransferase